MHQVSRTKGNTNAKASLTQTPNPPFHNAPDVKNTQVPLTIPECVLSLLCLMILVSTSMCLKFLFLTTSRTTHYPKGLLSS
jgi:hypothetical protein